MPQIAPPSRRISRNPVIAVLRTGFRVVCGVVILLDELVRPLYRPLIRRIAALRLMQAFEGWIARRSPYAVLVLIGVPYVVVEPLKFLALIGIANGHGTMGTLVFLLANLVSFVLIERIFTAGRTQLMTLRPMAWLIETAGAVRASVVGWLRLAELKARLRVLARWARLHLR
ncbi:hypothetical protein [Xanthobacter autotrophicus]|uniref:hypothetical protein n=1 Tax=Xanthobacter autotrophicus TaxID=280 RepID=UPI0024A7A305|nr:hypothetical protein [Xanthobacter autotrophicus]MDI4657625.1 hypothetical protein [Xanthobacter autotrophicus]